MGAKFSAFLIERDSMEKRRVGRTQLKIDVIGLGGAPLGGNFADLKIENSKH